MGVIKTMMSQRTVILVLLTGVFITLLYLFMNFADKTAERPSQQLELHDHDLVNKIWGVSEQQFISREALLPELLTSRYLLLGETHDNLSHHEHQAAIIADLHRASANVSVHFEMINLQQSSVLEQQRQLSTNRLIELLQEKNSGWDYDGMYRVIFEQTMQAGFTMFSANLGRKELMAMTSLDAAELEEPFRSVLQEVTLTADMQKEMSKEIVVAHCDALPEDMVAPMIMAQQLRDIALSQSLQQGNADIRVLITGNGHARHDRGVSLYLHNMDAEARSISIAFMEVDENKLRPADYAERWDQRLPFDYIWFTPRFDREDPCKGFADHLSKRKAN